MSFPLLFQAVAHDLSSVVDTAYPVDELSHPEYVNDDFRMFTFKVGDCKNAGSLSASIPEVALHDTSSLCNSPRCVYCHFAS